MTKKWNSGFPYPMLDSASGPHFKNHVIAAHAKHTSDSVAQVPWTLEARGVVFHAQDYAQLLPEEAGGALFAMHETTCRLQV